MRKPGRPRRVSTEASSVELKIRVTPSERAILVRLARENKQPPLTFLRDTVVSFLAEADE